MGSGGIAPPFLTSTLNGGVSSASRPGRFIPGERATGTQWLGGWVGHTAGMDAVRNRNPTVQPVARRYTD
jgi:hypothetical protein